MCMTPAGANWVLPAVDVQMVKTTRPARHQEKIMLRTLIDFENDEIVATDVSIGQVRVSSRSAFSFSHSAVVVLREVFVLSSSFS